MRYSDPVTFTAADLDYLETTAEQLAADLREQAAVLEDWDNFKATTAEALDAGRTLRERVINTADVYLMPQRAVNQEGHPDRYGHVLDLIDQGERDRAVELLSNPQHQHEAWNPNIIVDALEDLGAAKQTVKDTVDALIDRYGIADGQDFKIGEGPSPVEHVVQRVADDFEQTRLSDEESTALY